MDVAESRAINNLQNPYRGNFAGTGYGNILGSANLNGVNKFQNNVLNQINHHGNSFKAAPAGFSNGMNANLKLQNQLTQQGAKLKNMKRKQSLLQIQQQNQQLQNLRLLQQPSLWASSAQLRKENALIVGVYIKGVKIIVQRMGKNATIAPNLDILQKYAEVRKI